MACQWCVFVVCLLCFPHAVFLYFYCRMFTVGMFTVGMFTVGMLTVDMFTVGLVLFVLKRPPVSAPWPRRVSRFGVRFVHHILDVLLIYFSTCWLPFGLHARTVFHYCGIICVEHRFRIDCLSILGRKLLLFFGVCWFSVRARSLLNLQQHLFL